ncbi:MAG TPA: penicillin-binding protein 2 [Solirubrobacteraceae bacterium]|nr:penicillin-binding protein 2 [Solirubrobacteraceae bacterium]
MSSQIRKLFGLIVVLFALLVVFTTRWTVLDATALDNNPLNARSLIQSLQIQRGRILSDDGQVLARSVRLPGGFWGRSYPMGPLFAQAVGYDNLALGSAAGLERYRAPYLLGTVNGGLQSIFGPFTGAPQVGDDVQTTLDVHAQEVARAELAGRAGSVVALDPRTGAVLVMYSNPSYDDNDPRVTRACQAVACQLDRATQGQYPPGSTFKIVTTTAAINSGLYTPRSIINGNSPLLVSGVPLHNDGNQSWGNITLTTALTYSVNTVYAQVAERVGRPLLTAYMRRFGFYSKPPIDLPSGEVSVSRPFDPQGRPYPPASPNEDIGRIGIGEGGLEVTPLQMAMVAAAVANHGTLMVPHLTARIIGPDGQTVRTFPPTVYSHVMSPTTAAEITQMMRTVVDEGTGTPAALGSGIAFAGKTGTASIGPPGLNETQPWFIGFAPAQDPKVAVAVTVERTVGGFGGQVAGPIASAVVRALLAEGR